VVLECWCFRNDLSAVYGETREGLVIAGLRKSKYGEFSALIAKNTGKHFCHLRKTLEFSRAHGHKVTRGNRY
jgi:hypothetical protein